MRIEGPSALLQALLAAAPARSRAEGIPFQPSPPGPATTPPTPVMGAGPVASVAMLVTLAAAEFPANRRAAQGRSAAEGLDALATLHRDIVTGLPGVQRLSSLREWAKRRRHGPNAELDTELDAVLDEVELRILVELAKREGD